MFRSQVAYYRSNTGQQLHKTTKQRRTIDTRIHGYGGPNPNSSKTIVSTPHSGYHYDGSGRRFFEGWYWRVTLPGDGQSFALIYSIEDPDGGQFSGVGAQIMGPDDGYFLQYTKNVNTFWASRQSLELGAIFQSVSSLSKNKSIDGKVSPQMKRILAPATFDTSVSEGFQASSTWHQGRLVRAETGVVGSNELKSTVEECSWAFSVRPIAGWGDTGDGRQRATAGWLASLPVFEPHWQVLMAHGEATGWIEWGGTKYSFENAPCYAEKNWGGGFPSRWCWIQCNSFLNSPGTSVTAVGARRGLLQLPSFQEDVGMIGIHHQGVFYELNVKDSLVEWDVAPWGRWKITGKNSKYRAEIEAECDAPGTPLRAPTADQGLAPFCRDSFAGTVRIRVWSVENAAQDRLIIDLVSRDKSGAVEVGGGPWWTEWKTTAAMSEPIKQLLSIPIDLEALTDVIPPMLRPPGL